MAVYAIGDIHGCHQPFLRLLDAIAFCPERDRLWLVGDVVNRGNESLATLRWVYEHRDCITLVLGNHDLHLLAVAAGAAKIHGNDTIADVLDAPDGERLCGWLRQQPLAHYEHGWLMVHAGVLPMWDVRETMALAREVGAVIGGEQWRHFAPEMYGNVPDQWRETLSGAARWRVVVNALTRMRICTAEGKMKLDFSGSPDGIPRGYVPWFEALARQSGNTRIICGHWSALGLVRQDNVYAIDGGCLWGGRLAALRLQDKKFFCVDAEGKNQPP